MINRRHFIEHVGGLASLSTASTLFGQSIIDNKDTLVKNEKAAILIWLGGGPPTIDMWDVKFGAATGGPTRPTSTTGDFQINELMPKLASMANDFSLVRTMATREADHMRGSYYMHTGFKPNPNMTHPSCSKTTTTSTTRDGNINGVSPLEECVTSSNKVECLSRTNNCSTRLNTNSGST